MNYEQFDYEKYKAGRKAVTRDGREVTQLVRFEGVTSGYTFAGVVGSFADFWSIDGRHYNDGCEDPLDLFLLPEVREYWVAVDEDLKVYRCGNEVVADIRVKNNPKLRKAKLIIYG